MYIDEEGAARILIATIGMTIVAVAAILLEFI